MTTDMPIILLAAGQSGRMRGRDKLMEQVDGRPLVRRQANLARAVTTGPVIVALPPAPHPRYVALKGADVTLLPVADADAGMNHSLRAAFAALPPDAPLAMLLLGDLPELSEADLTTLSHAARPETGTLVWRGATEDGKPGHPIVFAAPLFAEFARLSGDGGGREVIAAAGGRIELVPLPGQHARADLDTPEDWAAWRERHGEQG